MATVLLLIIYIAFISLGLPDSLFGASWPAIYAQWGLPISYSSMVTLLTSVCTCASSLLSSRLINRFGTGRVTAVSVALTALALLGISQSQHFVWLVLLSTPLGFGGGAIDAGLNNYVALHYNAMQMNFLHCFYGVGVSLSPFLLSFALGGEAGWRGGYGWVALIQIGIAALVAVTLPLWKIHEGGAAGEQEESPITLSVKELLHIKGLPAFWLMFLAACAIEVVCGAWGSTYLVEHKGMPVDAAALTVTLYYLGIAVGRFVSGLLSVKLSAVKLVVIGQVTVGAALILLMLPLPPTAAGAALFLVGLGIAPIYPNLMYLTPLMFGRRVSQSVMGTHMAAAYVGILAGPAGLGLLTHVAGMGIFPYFMGAFFLLLVLGTVRGLRKKTETDFIL